MLTQRRLSLHHLSAMEVDAERLVDAAADAAFDHVCLFTEYPTGMGLDVPLVTADRRASLRARMDDRGISALNIDVFILGEQTHIPDFRRGLELGAALGAKNATVVATDPDRNRAVDNFAALCAIAADHQMTPGLEWMLFSAVTTLEHAVDLVTTAGQPNGRVTVDLLHLMQTGGSPKAILDIPSGLIGYVQLCDGPATPPLDLRSGRRSGSSGRGRFSDHGLSRRRARAFAHCIEGAGGSPATGRHRSSRTGASSGGRGQAVPRSPPMTGSGVCSPQCATVSHLGVLCTAPAGRIIRILEVGEAQL